MNKYETAKVRLLVYAMKYEWVKNKILENDIDLSFGLSNNCDELEIIDYINLVKEEQNLKKINELALELKEKIKFTNNQDEKKKILEQILNLKRAVVDGNTNR